MKKLLPTIALKYPAFTKLFFLLNISLLFFTLQANAQDVLNNQSIISLTQAKVNKTVIVSKIKSSSTDFDLSSNGLEDLKKGKVAEPVIEQMMLVTKKMPVIANADVIAMCKANIPKSLIAKVIANSPTNFDLSTNGLIDLKSAKVPDPIMKAMMNAKPAGKNK